jgi:hypothetical protein
VSRQTKIEEIEVERTWGLVKVEFTLEQAMKAQRGSSFFNLGVRWGWVVNATPRPLYPRE